MGRYGRCLRGGEEKILLCCGGLVESSFISRSRGLAQSMTVSPGYRIHQPGCDCVSVIRECVCHDKFSEPCILLRTIQSCSKNLNDHPFL